MNVGLRPADESDAAFLFEVYASTRADELALTEWGDAQKAQFLRMQFAAQSGAYARYENLATSVVLVDGRAAGRLLVARWPEEIRIVDIALLPAFRGSGAGTRLLRSLMDEAAAAGVPLTIHVERFNRALELYRRLGFEVAEELDVHLKMRWIS